MLLEASCVCRSFFTKNALVEYCEHVTNTSLMLAGNLPVEMITNGEKFTVRILHHFALFCCSHGHNTVLSFLH